MDVKHYRQKGQRRSTGDSFLLFDVRLDFQDVRSGYRGSESGLYYAENLADSELDWTPDMVRATEWAILQEISAPAPLQWPAEADGRIKRFFLKYYRTTILRNRELNLYSQPSESKKEFIQRTAEHLLEERRSTLAQIRDLFLRRFLEAEQKSLATLEAGEWGPEQSPQVAARIRDAFSEIRDQFSQCFLRDDWQQLQPEDLDWGQELDVESQERLEQLRQEFINLYNKASATLFQRADNVDSYDVTLSHSDIDVVSRAFFWS